MNLRITVPAGTTTDIETIRFSDEETGLREHTARTNGNTAGKAARQARERLAVRGRQNAAKARRYDFRKGGFRR